MNAIKMVLVVAALSGAFSAFACNNVNKPDRPLTQNLNSGYLRILEKSSSQSATTVDANSRTAR